MPRRRRDPGAWRRGPASVMATLAALALAGCAVSDAHLARMAAAWRADTSWAFEKSDVPLDPAFRFGRLANGMRYIVRRNALPAGTAIVRMEVAAGSLDETEAERGYAHFVEHMAFDGSTRVPEGEMVRLLERKGLAFGADTNASTTFEQTTYLLDLPRADPALMDTALMLMRETASALSFAPKAVERERGVVLAEMRDRNDWALRNTRADAAFFNPQARYVDRFPIGTPETLDAATAASLKAFWQREYTPARTTMIVIGDFDPATVQAAIARHFDTWRPAPTLPQPSGGPVLPGDRSRATVTLDPALAERVTAARHGRWLYEPDTLAQRREDLLRAIGYAIVNRRLQRVSRQPDPPFRGAGFGTGAVFEAGRTTRLLVDTVDGQWRRGLIAAALEYRRALATGFSNAEVAEQVANLQAQARAAAAAADTRGNAALAGAAFALLRARQVPSDPRGALQRLEAFAPRITPRAVLAALKRDAVPIKAPLLRFSGRRQPQGGTAAIRAAWQQAMHGKLPGEVAAIPAAFGYDSFGSPGTIASDVAGPLGIREVRFANGVMLNIRRTDLEAGRAYVRVGVDGGDTLETKADPLATELFAQIPAGGLGKHSEDALQSILAGRTVGADLRSAEDSFVAAGATTRDDLPLQLQLLAAYLTDPGYRPEGEVQYRLQINTFFARKDATPGSAMQNALGGILSDGDPRFTLQPPEAYRRLTFAALKRTIADRLAHGGLEVAIVGDVDEARAIAAVAATFGALPAREPAFRGHDDRPPRPFTADRSARIVRHTGPADQALLRLTWPTRDDADPVETLRLELLEQVVRLRLMEALRETLGKAYSPAAGSAPSHVWPGYGTFALAASLSVGDVPAARAAVLEMVRTLRERPVDADLLQRARAPMLEAFDNGLKTNAGWMSLTARAQSEPDRIDRYVQGKARLAAMTAADVQQAAQAYLDPARALEVLALPQGVTVP